MVQDFDEREKLNGLDLFSGIGGIAKALEDWVKPIAYCENDRYAQAVLLSRMHDGNISVAPIWDDVKTLDPSFLITRPDIIYGGFPCQDISVANTAGEGLEGKRSGLFFEIERIVREIRPRFVFLENVPAIRTRGGDVVGARLADARYDCRWITLSAAEVGANHQRKRWFLLAHPRRKLHERPLEQGEVCEEAARENANKSKRSGEVAYAESQQSGKSPESEGREDIGRGSKEVGGGADSGWWSVEPNVGRVAHGVPSRVERLKGLGNAVVPAQAKEAFMRLMWGGE